MKDSARSAASSTSMKSARSWCCSNDPGLRLCCNQPTAVPSIPNAASRPLPTRYFTRNNVRRRTGRVYRNSMVRWSCSPGSRL